MFELWRRWRRQRVLARDRLDPQSWPEVRAALPLLQGLSDEELGRLEQLMLLFLAEKKFEAVGGLELTEPMRLVIAAQACLPILNLGIDYYRGWYSVVVYPGGFMARRHYVDEAAVVHAWEEPLAGEAWEQGPVILSWEDVEDSLPLDGFNVVLHEFAHKLDMLTGAPNGLPPLHRDMVVAEWSAAMQAAYDDLAARDDAGEETPIDPYAAESPAEFFAVISEVFFELPHVLLAEYPAVYKQLARFYRQDPAERLPSPGAF